MQDGSPPRGPRLWLAGARPKTLPAAVVPVAVGTAAAVGGGAGGIVWWRFLAALIVALAIQIGTNYVNDYADGERGTDADRAGPLRLVASGLATTSAVKSAALGAFGVAAVAGLLLAAAVGWYLVPVGAVCFLAGWAYTGGPRPYGYYGAGELFVFVFFGLVATLGSTWVQIERLPGVAWAGAVAAGLLATALMVTNNLRDIPTDAATGKQTLAVRLGDASTRRLYLSCLGGTGVAVLAASLGRPLALLGLLGLVLAVVPVRQVRSGASGRDLIPVLEGTARTQLVTGLLLSLGLALGG